MPYVSKFMEYISRRGLSARIYLCVGIDILPTDVRQACLCATDNCFATPLIKDGNSDASQEYAKKLARIYPTCMIG